MAFVSSPEALYSWQDTDADLDFEQHASISSQITPKWKLRVMAREATSREMATSKLRRILDRNRTRERTGLVIGDSMILYD